MAAYRRVQAVRSRLRGSTKRMPGSTTQGPAPTPNQNALESFLGGTPASVFVKLLFISLVVGALLMWLDIRPAIFSAAFRIS